MTRMNRIDVWEFFEPQEVCNMQNFLVRINRFFKENKIKKASGGQPKKWLAGLSLFLATNLPIFVCEDLENKPVKKP